VRTLAAERAAALPVRRAARPAGRDLAADVCVVGPGLPGPRVALHARAAGLGRTPPASADEQVV
jgi:L-aspartate oxidase